MSLSPRLDTIEQGLRTLAPNLIINGAFDFWQRSTSGAAVGTTEQYNTIDRWRVRGGGAGSNTVARSTDVPSLSGLQYSASCTFAGASGTANIITPIEAAMTAPYVGETVTFSVWVKPAGSTAVNLQIHQTPTLDTWAANIISDNNVAFTQSYATASGVWQRISLTFVMPATGATGIAPRVTFTNDVGANLVAGAMLTLGSQAPSRFYRNTTNMQAELATCQRYFEKTMSLDNAPTAGAANSDSVFPGRTSASGNFVWSTSFKSQKRIVPTVTYFGNGVAGAGQARIGAATTTAVANTVTPSTFGFSSSITASTADQQVATSWTADAEL